MGEQGHKEDFEIVDVENYRGDTENQFSHEALVMTVLRKVLESGSEEMREGYWNEKSDKFGNPQRVYVADTRKVFTEAVKTAKMFITPDFDETASINIKKIEDDLKKNYDKLVELEKEDIENAPNILKNARRSRGIYFRDGFLNKGLPYYQEYIEMEVEAYREIATELNKLAQRLGYYKEEWLEG